MVTIPNKTVSIPPGLHKQIGPFALNILLVILLAATLVPPLHCAGGMLLLIGCGVHVGLHGRWIKAVILGTPKNITPTLRRQRRLFWVKLISGSLCGLSGLITLALHFCLTPIHALSGLVFLGLNIYHLVQHRNWFRKKRCFFLPQPGNKPCLAGYTRQQRCFRRYNVIYGSAPLNLQWVWFIFSGE